MRLELNLRRNKKLSPLNKGRLTSQIISYILSLYISFFTRNSSNYATMVTQNTDGWDLLHPHQQTLYELLLESNDPEESFTLDGMREVLGVKSLNTVVHHLKQLEKKGYIRRNGDYGNIEVLPAPVRDILYLNLYATVGCSPQGFFNDDNVKERIPFPAKKMRVNANSFLVEARGDSMEPLVHDQDLVLVDRTDIVSSHDTAVVVLNDGGAVLKKYYEGSGQVILQSLNSKYQPIVINPDEVRVVGIVRGVVRSFTNDSKIKKSR